MKSPEAFTTHGKIGGKNMSQLEQVGHMVDTVVSRGEQPVFVVSAFTGVTNALIKGMKTLSGTNYQEVDIFKAFETVRALHEEQANESFGNAKDQAMEIYDTEFEIVKTMLLKHREVSNVLAPVAGSFEARAQTIGLGERASKRFLELFLKERGHNVHAHKRVMAEWADGMPEGTISNRKMHEAIQLGVEKTVQEAGISRKSDLVEIFEGFAGGLRRGINVDIGRSYSDTTEIDVSQAYKNMGIIPQAIRFWKDVPGVQSTNPKQLKNPEHAVTFPDVGLREMMEMAAAGSPLMQISALALAYRYNLAIELMNIDKPESGERTRFHKGTIRTKYPFKSIVENNNIDAVAITVPEMADQKGFLSAISSSAERNDLNIDGVMAEGISITFTVPMPNDEQDRNVARDNIRSFMDDIADLEVQGETYKITDVDWRQGEMESISIVGDELGGRAGTLEKITKVFGDQKANIHGAVHGLPERRITFLSGANQGKPTVQELHDRFFAEK